MPDSGHFLDQHKRFSRAAAAASSPRPKQPRPIIILGAGGIVRSAHLPAYAKAGFPVLALADIEPGKAAELGRKYDVQYAFDSIDEAINFAPSHAVFDIAVPASKLLTILPELPRGAAVLMQKPMGETLEEARTIRDLCRRRELRAAVNFQLRYSPNHLAAQALAAAGVLGQLHDLEVQIRTYTPWQLWEFLAEAPRLEILYHSIHYLDLIRAWLGSPRGIYARSVRNPQTAQLAATKSTMLLNYGDLTRVFIATNHGHEFPDTQRSFIQWEGTGGAIRMGIGVNLDYPIGKADTLAYALRGDPSGWHNIPLSGNWFPDAFFGSMGALQAHVEGTLPDLPISFESAYETMALVEAAYRSDAHPGEPPEV